LKIAFVAPFFGKDAAGGAEFAARSVALHLADSGIDVEILTTCLKDLPSGITNNIHRPGTSRDGKLTIRRFKAETPDMANFGELNDFIIDGGKLTDREELQFMSRHVNSIDLLNYIAEHEADYDRFCFIPYLFGTTCFGIMIAPHKSIMIPCLHDEGYANLEIIKRAINAAQHLIFNARPEQILAQKLYGISDSQGTHIGLGVETDISCNAERFRHKFGIREPFLLYAGRRDTTKNVHTLIHNFEQFKRENPGNLKLVLIGPAPLPVANPSADIIDLGFVSEQEKRDAYAAAEIFCQPSLNESFSYVIMESWLCGTPCLVHEKCEVTKDHITTSGGGLYFNTPADFNQTVKFMLDNQQERTRMATSGKNYVLKNFAWPEIVRKYKQVLNLP
jgi:glycosyltransferase involved in cell wall biosynthesis